MKMSLAVNGSPEKVEFMGQEALKVPVTIITEIAMQGVSGFEGGPLFFPAALLEDVAAEWNGITIMAGHPFIDGVLFPAVTQEGLDGFAIGNVFNTVFDAETKSIIGDAFILVARANEIDPRIIARLNNGGRIGESFGAFLKFELGEGEFDGTNFVGIVTDMIPDHVALFANDEGACKIDDGCGAGGVKEKIMKLFKKKDKENNMKLTAEERAAHIAKIMAASGGAHTEAWLEGLACDILDGMAKNLAVKAPEVTPPEVKEPGKEVEAAGVLKPEIVTMFNEFGADVLTAAMASNSAQAAKDKVEADGLRAKMVKDQSFSEDAVAGMPLAALREVDAKFATAANSDFAGMGMPGPSAAGGPKVLYLETDHFKKEKE